MTELSRPPTRADDLDAIRAVLTSVVDGGQAPTGRLAVAIGACDVYLAAMVRAHGVRDEVPGCEPAPGRDAARSALRWADAVQHPERHPRRLRVLRRLLEGAG